MFLRETRVIELERFSFQSSASSRRRPCEWHICEFWCGLFFKFYQGRSTTITTIFISSPSSSPSTPSSSSHFIFEFLSSSFKLGVLISSTPCWTLPWSSLILVDVCDCWCSYVYLLIYCFLMLLEFSLGCWTAVIARFFYPSRSHYFDLKILYVGVNMFMRLPVNFHDFWWRFAIFKNSWQICPVLEHVMIFWKHWNLPFLLI